MKKKSASKSAFFNLRVLIGLCIALAGISLALVGLDAFASSVLPVKVKNHIITASNDPLVPVGFDCSKIQEKGIDRMENFRAGAIMIACGAAEGGSSSVGGFFHRIGQAVKKVLVPDYGAADVDLITGTETPQNITQSETYTMANPDNPQQVVVAYNDSRGRNANPINISGASVSTDGGTTFTRLTLANGQGPFANTTGDPVVLFHKPTQTWFTVWIGDGQCGGGLGGYKSTTPEVATSWTHFPCVHIGNDDRESGWSDTNTASPFYGRMYVSWNDFNTSCGSIGCLKATYSSDGGNTWHAPVQLSTSEARDVQITGDLSGNGTVYVAGMDEGGGGFPHNNINKIFKSTDGGNTWSNTYTGTAFPGPGVTSSGYFACMFSPAYWRHEGWGEPAAFNNVVSLVYAQHGTGADPGDVYYIRSTDGGVTFATPFKLNTDSTTRPQWQPNISVSPSGTLQATWYDARDSATCTVGNTGVPCYRMYSRRSNDNGATWLPDDTLSDVVSPLPAQPDPGIVSVYVGDYDYGSASTTKAVTSWADGRVAIGGQSQQDAFTDRDLVGFAVSTSSPACNSTLNTQPVDFVINLSDPVNPATVQASDFTVNGIPANTVALSNGNTTLTFHFSTSPVSVQGPQTMHIAAGAFNRASDNMPNFEFNCTFCYAITPLMVTTTVPAVGGTFSPPAPGNYNYDVNFNQPVDPASVQDSDLTVSGNSGPSVTGHSLLNGNTTVRFTLHMNFGGTLTASIGAGGITANTCNINAAFTGNYMVDGCPPQNHYAITQIGGSIVPGTTDTGNHIDDGTTPITLPFPYTLYDQTFTAANVDSNGTFQFVSPVSVFTNTCLPDTRTYLIFPYWDDQRTDAQTGCAAFPGGTCGIFTSISGTAPNRIFNIEWRTVYFANVATTANYELRLYEGQSHFDVVWGAAASGNTSATGGVQKSTDFDQYFCNGSGGATTGGQSYILQSCGTPTPTPTASPSATPTAPATATPTPTAPATATPTAPATATPTATATPNCTPNYTFTSGTGTLVPGTTDTGNHCDDCTTAISLPFSVALYDQTFTSATVGSNGIFAFGTNNNAFAGSCLPVPTVTYETMPFYRDQRTDCTSCGIFTTTTGTAPNRVFRVEYRTIYFGETSGTPTLNYEVNVYENGSPAFDYTYGLVNSTTTTGRITSIGVQQNTTLFTQFACDTTGQSPPVATGQKLTASLASCGSPTPTPTATGTATPSCTPGWVAGPDLPSVGVRMVGVYFPANGKFYGMGGRSADTAGSDFTHPFEYDPATNSWTTKSATYADNQVNNMACGVLTDAGTPYIYCVGGSAAGATVATGRVFRYNPVTDTIDAIAAPWPQGTVNVVPGGFTIFQNKLYILGGFDIPGGVSTNQIWEFTPGTNAWVQKATVLPVALGYIPTTTIGTLIYTGGGASIAGGLITDDADSFVYNPVADSISTIVNIPRPTGETRALNVNNKMWVMGGGRTAPNPSNEVDIYDPVAGTWSMGTPFVTARRNFPTDTDGSSRVWLAGGYAPTAPIASMEIFGICGTPSPTPTPTGTPSATPTCPPGGTPGPWTQAAPVGVDHYGGFIDSDGTVAYEGGGYSFSAGGTVNQFGKFNPATNTWTPLAPVPDLTNAEASGVYAPNVNKLFVFGGDDPTSGIVVNTTRIYDIATNTWSTGTPMPDIRAFMASGYFNGKIYLVGGYSTGNVSPAFLQTWEYDPVANTFATKTSIPAAVGFGGAGSGVINGHLYVAGGRDANITVIATLWDYDIAADTWTARANLPAPNNVPGSAVIGGKLWIFGGGNPFSGSSTMPTSGKSGVRAWFNRLLRPDTTNALQVYDPATNSWTTGPSLNQQRSFPAGTDVGNTAVAVGGYDGSTTTTSVEINVASGGCASPTPTASPTATFTPTATPTFTPTATATATATFTPTATATFTPTATATATFTPTATATATATATVSPRPTPTPRPRPTPPPRP